MLNNIKVSILYKYFMRENLRDISIQVWSDEVVFEEVLINILIEFCLSSELYNC